MKHNLPWNVSGIPPEAREIARAAAAKEGLSVGEWLTRRILSAIEEPSASAPAFEVPLREESLPPDLDQFGSRLPHKESQAELTFRRIDETLGTLARRLEASERSQLEAQRAMGAAAREINTATRDQSLAFQHLTTRIDRVERQTDTSALRDAVRALHQGLSRLADQIAKTATESSGQISALAHNVEALAGKIATVREDSNALRQDLEDKIQALTERVRQNEEQIATAIELEERLRHAEDRLKQAEDRIASQPQLDDGLAKLEQRLNFSEQRMHDALSRNLAAIQANFQEIAARLEHAEQRGSSARGVEEVLRDIDARIEAAERRNSEAIVELAGSIGETTKRIESLETDRAWDNAAAAHPPALSADLPPAVATPSERASFEVAPLAEAPPLIGSEGSPAPAGQVTATSAPFLSEPLHSSTENYLAQARRAAQAAAVTEAQPNLRANPRTRSAAKPVGKSSRRLARTITAAAALVLVAAVSGVVVTHTGERKPDVVALAPVEQSPSEATTAQDLASGQATPTEEPTQSASGSSSLAETPSKTASSTPKTPERAALVAPSKTPAITGPKAELGPQTADIDAKAALALGLKFADGNGVPANDVEAARWLQKAAEGGEPVAQYRLGTLYEKGRGVDANPREAVRWYTEAAKRGNRKAMHNLAVAYADGSGTEKNFGEAARWFQAAAELGLTDSQFNLAVLYERGLGVKTSLTDAYKWYAIAAGSGDSESKTRMAALGSQIRPTDRDSADRAAKAYRPQALNVAANDGP